MNDQISEGPFSCYQLGALESCREQIQSAYEALHTCYESGNKVMACGNGGSAADCEHIVGELMKGFRLHRQISVVDRDKMANAYGGRGLHIAERLQVALPAISLVSQMSLCTAILNDVSADMIFAQQVYGYGRKADVLIGISTSGRAKNVLNALVTARCFDIVTIGFTGQDGADMVELCDYLIQVPALQVTEVQNLHQQVYHLLCSRLEEYFFHSED